MLPGLSFVHLAVIVIVALLVLGPDKLPELARRAGHAYQELQRLRAHLHLDLDDLLADRDEPGTVSPEVTKASSSVDQGSAASGRIGGSVKSQARPMPGRQRPPVPLPTSLRHAGTTPLPANLPASVQPGRRRQQAPATPTWFTTAHHAQQRVTAGPVA